MDEAVMRMRVRQQVLVGHATAPQRQRQRPLRQGAGIIHFISQQGQLRRRRRQLALRYLRRGNWPGQCRSRNCRCHSGQSSGAMVTFSPSSAAVKAI